MILSGYVPTPVPGPTEVPTRVPGPVVVATEVPGPTIVATPMPVIWLRQITGILQAEAEIQVQVVGVTMDAAEALRGQGLLSAVISSMDLAPAAQFLRGQALITAALRNDAGVDYPVYLEGRGEILASGVAMILSAGVRSLAGQGAATAGGISTALQALVNLRGQGRVTASPTAMALTDPVARLLAGRGAITVTGVTQALSFARQRVNKNGGYVTDNGPVTGWTSDSTYPATITSNQLVVQGSGTATPKAVVVVTGWNGGAAQVALHHNGVSIGSITINGSTTFTISPAARAFADGDKLDLRVTNGFGSITGTITTGTYVEVYA